MDMAEYLSKYLSEKYEDEAFFAASKCSSPFSTSMNLESVAAMVDDSNITLTRLRIICNYTRYSFGKLPILPEEAVQNLVIGYMEVEYRK